MIIEKPKFNLGLREIKGKKIKKRGEIKLKIKTDFKVYNMAYRTWNSHHHHQPPPPPPQN